MNPESKQLNKSRMYHNILITFSCVVTTKLNIHYLIYPVSTSYTQSSFRELNIVVSSTLNSA